MLEPSDNGEPRSSYSGKERVDLKKKWRAALGGTLLAWIPTVWGETRGDTFLIQKAIDFKGESTFPSKVDGSICKIRLKGAREFVPASAR